MRMRKWVDSLVCLSPSQNVQEAKQDLVEKEAETGKSTHPPTAKKKKKKSVYLRQGQLNMIGQAGPPIHAS